jgi:ABC-2 type transport system permease protein
METLSPSSFSLGQPTGQAGLGAQARAFWAVVQREWLHLTRYPTWFLPLIIWPILFPAMYILGAIALAGPQGLGIDRFLEIAGTDNFLGYIVVGTTVWMWSNTMLWNTGLSLRNEQMRGTLESNWLTPTSRFYFLLGSGPVHMVSMLLFVLFTVIEFYLLFGLTFQVNLATLLVVLMAAMPALYGLGFTFASLVISARETQTFVFLVRGLVMIFCGISYPLSVMPAWMQRVAQWLPQTAVIHATRAATLNAAPLSAVLPDLALLAVHGVAWMALGYFTFRLVEWRARRKGALGQY